MNRVLKLAKEKPVESLTILLGMVGVTLGLVSLSQPPANLCRAISVDEQVLRDCDCLGFMVENSADYGQWLKSHVKETYSCFGIVYGSTP